jgi:hypothetical protein
LFAKHSVGLNMSIETDPQQQEAASPQYALARSSSRSAAPEK